MRRSGDIPYTLTYKAVKRINLRVKPPDGSVYVSAPVGTSASVIDAFVSSRADWIVRVQREMAQSPQRQADVATRREQQEWRKVVEAFTPMLISKWEPVLGVKAGTVAYRNMRSRWGSCQPSTGRICINTRLALYPPECLEYIVVHELCHLRVRGHGPAFRALLDETLPTWREAESLLR